MMSIANCKKCIFYDKSPCPIDNEEKKCQHVIGIQFINYHRGEKPPEITKLEIKGTPIQRAYYICGGKWFKETPDTNKCLNNQRGI